MTEKKETNELETKKASTRKVSQTVKAEVPVVEVAEEPTLQPEKQVEEEEKKPETVMYIGTSLPTIGLQQNALFNNGVPETIQTHIENCPAIGALLVPISNLSEARKNLTVQGTAEYMLNEQAVSYGRGEI